ncbi:tannase/feruloyl esterase family alpha/beta hydrolase [Microcoleus sp. FACHB-672]|uniref:tannase/feruloyl esterase family alpha/beta hydrolase n=1 Tax=Microcoleus sp. FACHB-672 TaxID=2692825 RepID=UPI001688F812|nr:tannase/feruloyl esterase family alpha/beta hydrolase [Microcoleus sp. FACHB-672]MBD2042814.1 tannase/feruloyl esterase family alpha/beta hydrolase [Microcoleus sp. FACHB-672]
MYSEDSINQLRIDFGYRSEDVTALAAKAISTAFYGESPRYSYFQGCSNGGQQALMEAQRNPNDFNGIITGAPAAILALMSNQCCFFNPINYLKLRTI